ncbi:hypothetical protein [Pseudomonas sp. TWP3-2]|uniref:hypothetical protein n=1 Tax=Pseudomonas sp. TWP3-2 TaxID=2804574 RepID=UPI003CEB0B39
MRKIIESVPHQFWMGLLVAAAIGAYSWVGESDYQQQVESAQLYCEMSDRGAWPVRPELKCPKPDIQQGLHLVAL